VIEQRVRPVARIITAGRDNRDKPEDRGEVNFHENKDPFISGRNDIDLTEGSEQAIRAEVLPTVS